MVNWSTQLKAEIDRSAVLLGISKTDIPKKIGIPASTYYGWFKKPDSMPVWAVMLMAKKLKIPAESIAKIMKG